MNLPIIISKGASLKEFIEYWGRLYSYTNEKLYDDCITKSFFDRHDIELLFVWKNGMKLSQSKQKALEEKIIARLNQINDLKSKPIMSISEYNSEFRDVSFVWRIFLIHIMKPYDIPVYDQNVHRAFSYIHGTDYSNISETINESVKEAFYLSDYYPFVKNIKGLTLRQIDRGLFAFGQFIKNRTYIKILE
jgi:hypothetical protein